MSSVVTEANSQFSSQPARPKHGQGGQRSGGDGFSGLVDENLAATGGSEANAPANQPRPSARGGNSDPQHNQSKPRNQTNSAPRSPHEPHESSATDAATGDSNTATAPAAELAVRTGLVTATSTAERVEAAAGTEAEQTPAPAPAGSGAAIVATAAAVQSELATEATSESVVESSDAISISNPPATIVAAPAEIAANALARVATDTGEAQFEPGVGTETETETDVQTPPVTTEGAPATDPDVAKIDAAPEAAAEAPALVQTAAADAQLDAKAAIELSAAVDGADPAKPSEQTSQINPGSKPDIKPVEQEDDVRATPEQPRATPESRTDRRVETNPAPEPRSSKPAETETRPAQRAAREAAASEQPQPTSFGASHASAPHVSNVAVHAAQLTAVPAASVAVPISGLAVEIAANVQIGRSRFDIRLDPPELGRIDVRLEVDRQGHVTSHLIVEKSATLDLLRRDAQHLERALQDAGLKTSDNGLQFSLRDQHQQTGRNDDSDSQREVHRLIVTDEEAVPAEAAGRSYGRMISQRGGIDIRV